MKVFNMQTEIKKTPNESSSSPGPIKRVGTAILVVVAMLLTTVAMQTASPETADAQGYCDAGWTYSNGNCYRCPSGYSLEGTSCTKWACPSGFYHSGHTGQYACQRNIPSSYMQAPQTIYRALQKAWATPSVVPRRSFGSALGDVMTSGFTETYNQWSTGLTNGYNNTNYAQNSCGTSGLGTLVKQWKPYTNVYTWVCMLLSMDYNPQPLSNPFSAITDVVIPPAVVDYGWGFQPAVDYGW